MFKEVSKLYLSILMMRLVYCTCEVFKTITTPDTGERLIEQDLSTLTTLDYAWGVWTKYYKFYNSFDDLSLPIHTMHVLTEKKQEFSYLVYYITLNQEEKSFTHSLYLFHQGSYQIRELKIDSSIEMDSWMFFYFCYQESSAIYNIFLYISKDNENVQMIQGGPYTLEIRDYKEYFLGGSSIFTHAFDSKQQQLKEFSGQISNMDLREGSIYYYSDIPTFLEYIELNCQPEVCENIIDILITSYMLSGTILRQPIAYINTKFMLSGWIILKEVAEFQTLESVLFRATLRYSYFQDKYQGDKAMYWKYIQSSLNENLNGFQITTYHNNQSESLNTYKTQESDSWLSLNSYYYEALTFWHWFVYQEGVDEANNIRLSIYFGHGKQEKTFTMNQQHQSNAKLYFNIGGDNYNQNFNGSISGLQIKRMFYQQPLDIVIMIISLIQMKLSENNYKKLSYQNLVKLLLLIQLYSYPQMYINQVLKVCHFSCKSCYGPLESHCLTCEDSSISKRELQKSKCLCQQGFVDDGNKNCKPRGSVLKNINISEATIASENRGCQRYQFQVKINGNSYCLDCPGVITPFGLYCIDCIQNPNSWYLNPRCTTDYLMPFSNDTNYVFIKRERKQKNFEYYLINQQDIQQYPVLESCFGCFDQTKSTFNFIEKYTLNRITRFLCKNCYLPTNGECVKVNMNCDECDNYQQCISCESNYALYENKCFECPLECPNCKYNQTGYYCKECITGYHFNSTFEQCQQCGQFCKVCIYSSILNNLQCVRCIHDQNYFISVEKLNCKIKSLPNCEIEVAEHYVAYFNKSYLLSTQQYSNSLDIVVFQETLPAFQLCLKCENGYINKMLVQQYYECSTVDSLGPFLPDELKLKVLESKNNDFQLAYISLPQNRLPKLSIIYGANVNSYSSIAIISNPITGIFCKDTNCMVCINNYVQEQQYCVQCYNGYYSSTLLGKCFQCPSTCSSCLEQNNIYQDAWKWQYKINYHFRNSLFENLHNFNAFGTKLDSNNFEIICTACPQNGILYNNKCYPKCNCDACIIENDQSICVSCHSLNTKTVYHGECHICPQFCELCREITDEEKLQINPYFQPDDITLQRYAQQCIKRQSEPPTSGILYFDPTLGYEINCQNPEKRDCYLYLEIPINLYCTQQAFDNQFNSLETSEEQNDFLSKNALISGIFSSININHFSVETNYLFNELNQKSVKLVRYILNVLPNTGDCIINKNTFIKSEIRRNVFTVQYLELTLQSQSSICIYLEDNITFYEFTTINLKNLQIIPNSITTSFNIKNLYSVSVLIEQIKIKNVNQNQFRIEIQNPNNIIMKNFEILDTKLNNLNGIINYYFTQNLTKTLVVQVDQFLISNCQIINSNLIVQILDSGYGNQQLKVNNFKSLNNKYVSSNVFYTQFINSIRESIYSIEQFNSEHDELTNSSLCNISGAKSVELRNILVTDGIFNFKVQLFKMPLFSIDGLLILNNNFNSPDNVVITNKVDALYKDNIKQNIVSLKSIAFENNNFVGSKVFFQLQQSDQFLDLEVKINGLTIHSNKFTFQNYNGTVNSGNSSLYFDVKNIVMENVNIIRAFTLPEISIMNVDKIVLKNIRATLENEFKINLFHQYSTCLQKTFDVGYGSLIQVFNAKVIQIEKLEIIGFIIINLPIITIKSLERSNIRYSESIDMKLLNLINNTIILTQLSEQPCVISIISEQEQQINLQEIKAVNNHHHTYQEDQQFKQSSTIFINNPNSEIILSKSVFENNIITNNQGSNLVFLCGSLEIKDSYFNSQNDLQYQYLKDRLIWGYQQDEIVFIENLHPIFPIKSKGGNAFCQADFIFLRNVTSQNSIAQQGGAFYLGTQSNGIIEILNCNFNFSQTNLLMTEKSQGGTLFIDASQSDLNLLISENLFSQSFSRQEGGTLFVEPSRYKNQIVIQKNVISNVYSLKTSFFKLPIIFTSNSLILNVEISDLQIQNTYKGFLQYLGFIQELSESEIKVQNTNYLISIERGNVTVTKCNFFDLFDYGVMEIINAESITLKNIQIQNLTLISGSTLNFKLNKKYQTNVQLVNVQLISLKEETGDLTKPIQSIPSIPQRFYKCLKISSSPEQLQIFYNQQTQYIISLYNLYTLITKRTNPGFIFQVDSISSKHQISMKNINFQNIICFNCKQGILKFINIEEQINQNLIHLNLITMEDNQCGLLSCLVLSSKEITSSKNFTDVQSKRILNEVENYYENKLLTTKLEFGFFKNNSGTYGGAVYISSISILIKSCQFLMNNGIETGGAIYFDYSQIIKYFNLIKINHPTSLYYEQSLFLVYNSQFQNNQAKVGGAIFLENYAIPDEDKTNILYSNNKASLFSKNVAGFPVKLTLKIGSNVLDTKTIESNHNQVIQQIEIKKYFIGKQQKDFLLFPSGQVIKEYQIFNEQTQEYVPLNLTFRIIPLDKGNGQIKALDGSKCTFKGRSILDQKEGEFQNNFTSLKEIEFNQTSQDYNLDQMIITFDPDYSHQDYLQLEIMCDSVKIPIFDEHPPYLLKNYFTNYKLRVNLQTFPCQRGEYKTPQATCKLCDPSQYQYNVRAGEQCKIKDQIKMKKVSSARIMLRSHYWRPYESSENIEYCLNMPENCIGGWNPGNDLCSEAHIGALCEQCDLYNVRGQGSFSMSTIYKCGNCENVSDNATKIILISIWTMISIFLSVKGTIETINKVIIQQKRILLKIAISDPRAGQGNVLIKVLTNYFQIIGVISTFQLQMPNVLQSTVKSVGNPIEAMSLSLDCFLVDITDIIKFFLFDSINIIYFRMIWALIMPLIYILTFIMFYVLAVSINLTYLNKSAFTTTAIYLFIYFQPNLIGGFISLLSFRQISNYYWIQGNVAYKYDTDEHLNWILIFILPATLALALIIPAYMFISLYLQRNKLENENTRKNWGYLYNEYQRNAYFWEIVKILQKGFIIMFLTFYEDLIIIKGALVFIIVFIYQLLTKRYHPYYLIQLNIIDEFSTLICGTSIVLSITIYQANLSNNQEIILPFYIFLIGLNSIFILYIVWGMLLAQLEDQQHNLDKIRDKINQRFPNLINSNYITKRLLTNRQQQISRIHERFQKVRKYLLQIVRSHPGFYLIHTQSDSYPEKPKTSESLRTSNEQLMTRNFNQKPKTNNKVYPIDFDIKLKPASQVLDDETIVE